MIAQAMAFVVAGAVLAGCAAEGPEVIRFTFSKREAIAFMEAVVADYNASQDQILVKMDTSGVDPISASFVRGKPPDIMLANYNFEVARFVERCTLSDLAGTEAAAQSPPELQPLIDQYGKCEGRISALPYSVMAASVIYNKAIFAEHELEVPTTWEELIEVCDKLEAVGVTPFYATFKDDWTVAQGWYDYSVGGSLDVLQFFDAMNAEGAAVGADSATSFQKDFADPVGDMVHLAENYVNADAASRAYGDGNVAFAEGQAAMYLQGPWAFSEIAKTAPDLELGTFPLPMTSDPADLAVRVNMDLAAMIPVESKHQEAARDFLAYLYQPEVIESYNASQLGFTPVTDAAPPSDPRVAGMVEYYNDGRIYQGPSVLVPKTIPTFNYTQALVLGSDPAEILATMDADWARVAFRAPKAAAEAKESVK
jgi:raffinose/stachyose/melibiose transport system substrate-binding protein